MALVQIYDTLINDANARPIRGAIVEALDALTLVPLPIYADSDGTPFSPANQAQTDNSGVWSFYIEDNARFRLRATVGDASATSSIIIDATSVTAIINSAIGAAQAGYAIAADLAARDAFFATEANRGKLVYVNNNNGSASDPANGLYEYNGGSPRKAQGFISGLEELVQPLVDAADIAAASAALSSATAESAAGPTYPNTAAGLAATTSGQSFAVDNGDGTVTVYLNSSGSAVAQRRMATTAALPNLASGYLSGKSFTTLRAGATVIPSNVQMVITSAFGSNPVLRINVGSARYIRDDDTVTEAFATQHPLVTFRAPDETGAVHGYRLIEQVLTPEMAGGRADSLYTGATAPIGTDNTPAFEALIEYSAAVAANLGPLIRAGVGNYYFSRTLKIKRLCTIEGSAGAGIGTGGSGTIFLWPKDITGILVMDTATIDPDTGLTAGSTATGTILRGFGMLAQLNGTNRKAHGVAVRARVRQEAVRINGFAGNAFDVNNTGGAYAPGGNANNWTLIGGRLSGCLNGIYTQGGDSNGGSAFHVDCSANLQAGILDRSFLGCHYFGCHENGNGALAKVQRGGIKYYAKQSIALFDDPTPLSTTEPGTNPNIWEPVTTSAGGFVEWVSGGEYYPGGQKISTNANARTTFIGGYSESGFAPSYIVSPAVIIGGLNGSGINGTGALFNAGNWNRLNSVTVNAGSGFGGTFTGSATTVYKGATIENTGSYGNTRGAALNFGAGLLTDGVTPVKLGYVYGRGAGVGFGWTDPTTQVDELAIEASRTNRALIPMTDNNISLGIASFRYSQVFAANATINTSDARTKTDILPIDDALLDAWADVEWRQFRFTEAVAEKGDGARIHTGVVAQQVRDALAAHGVDGTRYGLLCFDQWDDEWEEWEDEYEERPTVYVKDENDQFVMGEDGEPIVETPAERVLIREAGRKLIREAGELWGVRYTEAFAVEAAYQRRRMDQIEARLAAMEAA